MSPTLKDHILIDTLHDAVGGGVNVVPTIDSGKIKLDFNFEKFKLCCRI